MTFWPHFNVTDVTLENKLFISPECSSTEFGSQLQQNQSETNARMQTKWELIPTNFLIWNVELTSESAGGLSVLDSSDFLNSYFSEEKFSPEY